MMTSSSTSWVLMVWLRNITKLNRGDISKSSRTAPSLPEYPMTMLSSNWRHQSLSRSTSLSHWSASTASWTITSKPASTYTGFLMESEAITLRLTSMETDLICANMGSRERIGSYSSTLKSAWLPMQSALFPDRAELLSASTIKLLLCIREGEKWMRSSTWAGC